MDNLVDTLLIGRSDDVLIVGRKRLNESVEIINAFQGGEVRELYEKLITKKEAVKDE